MEGDQNRFTPDSAVRDFTFAQPPCGPGIAQVLSNCLEEKPRVLIRGDVGICGALQLERLHGRLEDRLKLVPGIVGARNVECVEEWGSVLAGADGGYSQCVAEALQPAAGQVGSALHPWQKPTVRGAFGTISGRQARGKIIGCPL